LFLKIFCHFELEVNLGMILGVVDLGRCFESIFGAHLGWGRFGGCFGSKFGLNSRVMNYKKIHFKVVIYKMYET
jgi:hypothetical protein